tara:strand:- start:674 stop:1192 length:519 start_codon:yes stop_codon:yes gene_type:complete
MTEAQAAVMAEICRFNPLADPGWFVGYGTNDDLYEIRPSNGLYNVTTQSPVDGDGFRMIERWGTPTRVTCPTCVKTDYRPGFHGYNYLAVLDMRRKLALIPDGFALTQLQTDHTGAKASWEEFIWAQEVLALLKDMTTEEGWVESHLFARIEEVIKSGERALRERYDTDEPS